ncbi:MAG: hypothetical protein AB9M60_07755 [Leptothrix sp. (in: b-proteobacteria)]
MGLNHLKIRTRLSGSTSAARRGMRPLLCTAGLVMQAGLSGPAVAADDGVTPSLRNALTVSAPGFRLSRAPASLRIDGDTWTARLELSLRTDRSVDEGVDAGAITPGRINWQLLGDYHFAAVGGLRATGGLLGPNARGLGASLASADPATPATYVGIGLGSERHAEVPIDRNSGWGWSADLGLMALRDSVGWRLGGPVRAPEDGLRDWRLRPMLQLGASYAF